MIEKIRAAWTAMHERLVAVAMPEPANREYLQILADAIEQEITYRRIGVNDVASK